MLEAASRGRWAHSDTLESPAPPEAAARPEGPVLCVPAAGESQAGARPRRLGGRGRSRKQPRASDSERTLVTAEGRVSHTHFYVVTRDPCLRRVGLPASGQHPLPCGLLSPEWPSRFSVTAQLKPWTLSDTRGHGRLAGQGTDVRE